MSYPQFHQSPKSPASSGRELAPEATGLLLASASPRRAELLRMSGVEFDAAPTDIDERRLSGEAPVAYARRLASEKAAAARPRAGGRPILAADTVVFIGDEIFDKPQCPAEAARSLANLSGRVHNVVSAFCLLDPKGAVAALEAVVSRVSFRELSERDIAAYVAGGEGFDKAGAYGIQGEGAFLIDRVDGSYTNILGLPLAEVLSAIFAMYSVGR